MSGKKLPRIGRRRKERLLGHETPSLGQKKQPRATFLRSPRGTTKRLSNVDGGTTAQVQKIIRGNPMTSREIAMKLGIGQKGALYHLSKLRTQRLVVFDARTTLWKAKAPSNTLGALLKQLRFIIELKGRAKGQDRILLGEVADTIAGILSRDFGVEQSN